jgi:hypothetical protein
MAPLSGVAPLLGVPRTTLISSKRMSSRLKADLPPTPGQAAGSLVGYHTVIYTIGLSGGARSTSVERSSWSHSIDYRID